MVQDTVFHTNVRAAASDFLSAEELTISSSRFAIFAGFGVSRHDIAGIRVTFFSR